MPTAGDRYEWIALSLETSATGIGVGMFGAPNSSVIMGSVGHPLDVPELGHGAVAQAVLPGPDLRAVSRRVAARRP
jgi:hypothetical protein